MSRRALYSIRVKPSGFLWLQKMASKALPNKMSKSHGCERKRNKGHREDQLGIMRQIFHGLCPLIAIGAQISSSFRGRPNRKWPTHARWSLRRRWRRVDAGSVPRVGQAFGSGAGGRGLAGLQAVKRAAAPPGIIHALDAKRILRHASLGRNRNVIDRPESCCSEQRGEGYTDHFRTFMSCRD